LFPEFINNTNFVIFAPHHHLLLLLLLLLLFLLLPLLLILLLSFSPLSQGQLFFIGSHAPGLPLFSEMAPRFAPTITAATTTAVATTTTTAFGSRTLVRSSSRDKMAHVRSLRTTGKCLTFTQPSHDETT
jgi:ABC-type spermidine/putrescine transport system permease subunit II